MTLDDTVNDLRRLLALKRQRVAAVDVLIAERQRAAVGARDQLRDAIKTSKDAADAAAILNALADSTRAGVKDRVESIVTAALVAVFGSDVSFAFDVQPTKSGVRMYPKIGYAKGVATSWRSTGDVGGGVIDIVSFALRLAVLLSTPDVPRVLILDEPFRHVSDDKLPAVAAMLRALADQTNVQFIIVSHEPQLAEMADRHITVVSGFFNSDVLSVTGELPQQASDE